MQLFVTIREESLDATLRAIAEVDPDHDGIEVRAEAVADLDVDAIRRATPRPLIVTYRGLAIGEAAFERAIAAGIDFVDVEFRDGMPRELVERHRERVVLSHHDFEGMERLEETVAAMSELRCAHVKLAVTPHDFASNERLMKLIAPGRSTIGMGERGLYSRILAPFRGSALTFVAAGELAAPSQLTHRSALAIYGSSRAALTAERVFAVAGDPAGHSLSPAIHNRLFREKRVRAAYTIASFATFEEVAEAFLRGEPCGLSVTAPFKEDALRFAQRIGAAVGPNAFAARAVNTLVNVDGCIVADNTDVDGFEALIGGLGPVCSAAIAGAGATARAAAVALSRRGIRTTTFNRTAARADRPLTELPAFDGDLVIDTLPAGAEVELPRRRLRLIQAAYGPGVRSYGPDVSVIDGLALLQAQAARQHELFMRVFGVPPTRH